VNRKNSTVIVKNSVNGNFVPKKKTLLGQRIVIHCRKLLK